MDNYISFIDGTVIGIARPGGSTLQNVACNGHKRKNSLKYQAVYAPDGLIAHAFGPMEGQRHDWTLFARSELDEQLGSVLVVKGMQYCLHADSGYSERIYLQVPFQGDNLPDAQRAQNTAMSSAHVTVE